MTSSLVISHVTLESSVFIILINIYIYIYIYNIYIYIYIYIYDVRWRYYFGSWCHCCGRWRNCPYKAGEESNGGCSFQVVVNKCWTCSNWRNGEQKGKDKIINYYSCKFQFFKVFFFCCMSKTNFSCVMTRLPQVGRHLGEATMILHTSR